MMFPGDDSGGAGPEEYVNCRCALLPADDYEVVAEEIANDGLDQVSSVASLDFGTSINQNGSVDDPELNAIKGDNGIQFEPIE